MQKPCLYAMETEGCCFNICVLEVQIFEPGNQNKGVIFFLQRQTRAVCTRTCTMYLILSRLQNTHNKCQIYAIAGKCQLLANISAITTTSTGRCGIATGPCERRLNSSSSSDINMAESLNRINHCIQQHSCNLTSEYFIGNRIKFSDVTINSIAWCKSEGFH